MLKADGFDEAFIGIGERCGLSVYVYDQEKCIEILMKNMSREEAVEYFEYNTLGAFMGEGTPIFLRTMSFKEAEDES
jgi:hypothetical protein